MAESNGALIDRKIMYSGVSAALVIGYISSIIIRWRDLGVLKMILLLTQAPLSLFVAESILKVLVISGICYANYVLISLWAHKRVSTTNMLICLYVISLEIVCMVEMEELLSMKKEKIGRAMVSSIAVYLLLVYILLEEKWGIQKEDQKEKKEKKGLLQYLKKQINRKIRSIIFVGVVSSIFAGTRYSLEKKEMVKSAIESCFMFALAFILMYFMYCVYFYNVKYFSIEICVLDKTYATYSSYNMIILDNYMEYRNKQAGKVSEKNTQIVFCAIMDMLMSIQEMFCFLVDKQIGKDIVIQRDPKIAQKVMQSKKSLTAPIGADSLYRAIYIVWIYLMSRIICCITEKRMQKMEPILISHLKHRTAFTAEQKEKLINMLKKILKEIRKILNVNVSSAEDRINIWIYRIEEGK